MTLRDRFEARYRRAPYEWSFVRQEENDAYPGQYRDYHAQCAWEAYQAAMEDAVPEGWVLVPKEPTDSMISEGFSVPWLDADEYQIRGVWENMVSAAYNE